MKHRTITTLALFILILPGVILLNACSSPAIPDEARAAIIDQLSVTEPNPSFIDQITSLLQRSEFKVGYYQGDQVTVDLYRNLPAFAYDIIIFRAHSGLMGNGTRQDQKTCLFTNQPYTQKTEIGDQLTNRLVEARVNEGPPLFGIGADFVNKSMRGRFNNTAIMMMGCSSLESDDMARSFINKGAAVYLGWTAEVGLKYDEEVTLSLLHRLSRDNMTIETAVEATMQEKGPDPHSGATLKSYSDPNSTHPLTELFK